jgi:hypothetical protein
VFAPGVFAIAALLILGVPSCAGLSAIRVMHGPAGVIILALVAMPLTLIAVPLGDWLAPRSGWRRLVAFAGGGALAGLCPAVGYGMARGPDASAVATAFVLFLLGAVAGLVAGLFPPPRRDLTPRSPP